MAVRTAGAGARLICEHSVGNGKRPCICHSLASHRDGGQMTPWISRYGGNFYTRCTGFVKRFATVVCGALSPSSFGGGPVPLLGRIHRFRLAMERAPLRLNDLSGLPLLDCPFAARRTVNPALLNPVCLPT